MDDNGNSSKGVCNGRDYRLTTIAKGICRCIPGQSAPDLDPILETPSTVKIGVNQGVIVQYWMHPLQIPPGKTSGDNSSNQYQIYPLFWRLVLQSKQV